MVLTFFLSLAVRRTLTFSTVPFPSGMSSRSVWRTMRVLYRSFTCRQIGCKNMSIQAEVGVGAVPVTTACCFRGQFLSTAAYLKKPNLSTTFVRNVCSSLVAMFWFL